MDALCDALSLDSLRVLHVRHEFGSPFAWTPQRWIELFHRCRAVEHVHIAHTAVPFIVALGLPILRSSPSEHDIEDGPESPRLFLENLQSLTLKHVNLEARLPKKAKTACESIVQRLAVRKQLKALPTIRVSADCLIGPESKEALEAVADVVQWLPEPED
ncbi:hypothetical protein EWM64_g1508 [Hericium alpestre]|uniref:Uncharacterized protein n=1 Tax=Hericium alpestre TaxID=135208 RepID=A0A4Z0A6Z9_9AGAM|nr:hypothetical protein EWM64_g1508 [Hericium alpestre]